jgi:mono/diheme cytochrome c family protein
MKIRTGISMAILFASTMAIAQGADVYKTKCQSCHGATGVPDPSVAKYVGVKPATDPAVKALSQEKMIAITTNGLRKMPAFKGKLTDAQIRDCVSYYRTLMK